MAKVLVVIAHDRFRDEEYTAICNALNSAGHLVQVGSSHHTEAQGHFGLIVKPDINVAFVEPRDYDALVFIGGHGVEEFFLETGTINLIRNFSYEKKIIAVIGLAVEILVYAGIISGKKVTCLPELIEKVQGAGAYYTGRPTEIDGDILTSVDSRTGGDFASALVKSLDFAEPNRGLR